MKSTAILLLLNLLLSTAFCQSYKEEINAYREKYKQDFLEDDHSPLKTKDALKYLRFFEPDEGYRITTTFKKTEDAIPFDMATLNGSSKKYIEYGRISFSIKGQSFTLTLYQGIKLMENPDLKDYLFLPFTDETNGNESYGSGRYLEFRIGDIKDNHLIIDFNKAYNPYCAFSSGYNCPKPPEENNLKIAILAGEKKYAKDSH